LIHFVSISAPYSRSLFQGHVSYREAASQHSYRNSVMASFALEVAMINFPTLIWSLPISNAAKVKTCSSATPWKSFREILCSRAVGSYSLTAYRQHIRPGCDSLGECGADRRSNNSLCGGESTPDSLLPVSETTRCQSHLYLEFLKQSDFYLFKRKRWLNRTTRICKRTT